MLAAAATALVLTGVWERAPDPEPAATDPDDAGVAEDGPPQPTLLLVAVDDRGEQTPAARLAVLAHDREPQEGTAVLVPTGTVAEVPGHGNQPLGDAYHLGGSALSAVSVGNLLGVDLAVAAVVSSEGWALLADSIGGVEVALPTELVDATSGRRFAAGTTRRSGEELAELVLAQGEGESELDTLPRFQQVLAALLDAVADDPDLPGRWVAPDEGDPAITTSDPGAVVALLRDLADARAGDRFTTWTLPVAALSSSDGASFRLDTDRAEPLLDDRLASAREPLDLVGGRDVEILDGTGTPTVGQQVTELLLGGGYRVVQTGNADRFTYETTRIVLHDDSPEQVAVGRDLQERLGVGELELAATPGSVVDVTIVVGADLLD